MNFFQKIGNSLARFMYGRNGVDQLGFVTLWAAIILDVVNLFVRNQVAYSILSAVAMVLSGWCSACFPRTCPSAGRRMRCT